jgi:hypothetical protein
VILADIIDSTRLDRLDSYREDLSGTPRDYRKYGHLSEQVSLRVHL